MRSRITNGNLTACQNKIKWHLKENSMIQPHSDISLKMTNMQLKLARHMKKQEMSLRSKKKKKQPIDPEDNLDNEMTKQGL